MGSFTFVNGPQGMNGPSAKDITQFIDAYQNLSALLHEHVQDKAADNVHKVADYVAQQLSAYIKTADLGTKIAADATVRDIQSAISTLNSSLNGKVANDTLDDYASKLFVEQVESELRADISRNTSAITLEQTNRNQEVLNTKNELLALIGAFFNSASNILSATALHGKIDAVEQIDYKQWKKFSLQYAGTGSVIDTDNNGLFIIGEMSNIWENEDTSFSSPKAARCYLKYINSNPFDAIIDMTATKHAEGTYTGTLLVAISKAPNTWENLKFHLVYNTDENGKDHIYLGMSANALASSSSATVNVVVRAAGVNFIPGTKVSTVAGGIVNSAKTTTGEASSVIASAINIKSLAVDKISDTDGDTLYEVHREKDSRTKVDYKYVVFGADDSDAFRYYRFLKRPVVMIDRSEEGGSANSQEVFVTNKDLMNYAAYPIGAIIQWPNYEERTHVDPATGEPVTDGYFAVDVPAGWHATDGSELSIMTDDPDNPGAVIVDPKYKDITQLINGHSAVSWKDPATRTDIILPIQDFSIIRLESLDIKDPLDMGSGTIDLDNINTRLEAAEASIVSLNAKDNVHDAQFARTTDSVLSTDLAAEVTRAQAAEQTNAAAIAAEEQRATTAEGANATAISNEADTRASEITRVEGLITTETGRATAAEQANAAAIATETGRATAAEQTNATAISNEEQRATTAEGGLNVAITTETGRATAAEQANAAAITTAAADTLAAAKTYADTAVADEADTRTSEITRVEGLVTAETNRATAAEGANATAISDEETRAKAAEQANATAISDEETRAKTAEQANATAISDEVTRATGAEGDLRTGLTQEVTDRGDADTAINTRLDNFLRGTKVYASNADLPTSTPDADGNIWQTGDRCIVFTGTVISVKVATVTGTTITWS